MTYRPEFHLTPPQGRLNDPNGLTLIGDELHVFYQHDPAFGHGPKRTGWGHAVTTLGDGRWRHLPDALYPDFPYDAHGCYSGCSVVHDGKVRLFYTGNLKQDGERIPSQNLVEVHNLQGPMGGSYRRHLKNPLINGPAHGYTGHYRDPHVTRLADGTWRMVLGAQRENHTGAVVVYLSQDLYSWEFLGEIEFVGIDYNTASAYMWECPNLVRMRDHATGEMRDVLVFCPQFLDSDECGYLVGTLDGLRFEVEEEFRAVDFGHHFYAPQLIGYGEGDALLLGWMGLPAKDDTPTLRAEGWVHQLTLPRHLKLIDGHLHTTLLLPDNPGGMHIERHVLGASGWTATLRDSEGTQVAVVEWAPDGAGRGMVSLLVDGLLRWAECAEGELMITVDGTALEITAGGGQVAFSSAVFPAPGAHWVVEVSD